MLERVYSFGKCLFIGIPSATSNIQSHTDADVGISASEAVLEPIGPIYCNLYAFRAGKWDFIKYDRYVHLPHAGAKRMLSVVNIISKKDENTIFSRQSLPLSNHKRLTESSVHFIGCAFSYGSAGQHAL